MSELKQNLEEIRSEIANFCEKTGRKPEEITMVAVTKTVDIPRINEAISYGVTHVGENKVQEVLNKFQDVTNGVKWHLIGHLQSNKVKYIIDKVDLIHSVDSLSLAKEINLRAEKIGRIMEVLVQVNPADEESKFGIPYETTVEFVEQLAALPYIRVMGLMTIAPYFEDLEKVRPFFRMMKMKFDELREFENDRVCMKYLSMGMTGDYMVALEEGANIVRIGTGIFGHRDYSKN